MRSDTMWQQLEMGRKYGPLFRLGPNIIMFGDADIVRKLGAARSPFTKGPFYELSRFSDEDNVFSACDESRHRDLKTKLSLGYSGKEGVGFEPKVDQILGEFIHLMDTKYISTATDYRPVDFAQKMMFFALDVISEVGWSEALGFIRNDKDMHQHVELNNKMMPLLASFIAIPWMGSVLKTWPLSLLQPHEGNDVGFGRLMGFTRAAVSKRFEPDAEEQRDMLQAHIRNGVTKRELMDEMILEIVAGSDTTATAIRITLLCLLTNPSAFFKLRSEIDRAISDHRISSPITNAEAVCLPYLQAVIREGMRLYPVTNSTLDKIVPAGGVTLRGYFIPEGTLLATNTVYMLREKEMWGEDSDVFRPERWIEMERENEAKYKEWCGVLDLLFGYGKYVCLGKSLALMELNKIYVELLRRYDLSVVSPHRPIVLQDCSLWVIQDFWLRISKRDV